MRAASAPWPAQIPITFEPDEGITKAAVSSLALSTCDLPLLPYQVKLLR